MLPTHEVLCRQLLEGEPLGAFTVDLSCPIEIEKPLAEAAVADVRLRSLRGESNKVIAKAHGVKRRKIKWLLKSDRTVLPGVTRELREVLRDALNNECDLNPRELFRLLVHLDFVKSIGSLKIGPTSGSCHQGWYPIGGKTYLFKSKLEAKIACYYQQMLAVGQLRAWEYDPKVFKFDTVAWQPDFFCSTATSEHWVAVCVHTPDKWPEIVAQMTKWYGPNTAVLANRKWFKEHATRLEELWDNSKWVKKRILV